MKNYPFVHQLGFVVADMEKGMDEYGKIYHIKKWYKTIFKSDDEIFYRGRKIDDPGFANCMGYCGKTEIELITTSAKESLHANFLRDRGPGLHHVSFFTKDLDASVDEYKAMGFEVMQSGIMHGPTTVTRYAYIGKPDEGYGRLIEFSASKMFDRLPVIRGKSMMWLACLTGDMKRVR